MPSTRANFFIIGAPKCGTTSMAQWLGSHPEIFMSPVKEPHFFNADDKQLISTLERYEELFLEASERHIAVGEASVWYLSSALAIPNILRYQPAARFIVMLRNPLEMAPALHMETVFSGHENILDFLEAWKQQERRRRGGPLPAPDWVRRRLLYGDICSLGAQYKQLLSLVPEDRVLTVLLEDLVDDPRTQYVRTLQFLGLHNDGRLEFPFIISQSFIVGLGSNSFYFLLGY